MAFDDETADILGGPILQNKSVGFFSKWATLSLSFKATLVLGLGFLAWLLLIHARDTVFKWQEYSYKKAMRRRHGIPDNDNRPFTVAYAAATRARAEREAQGKSKEKQFPDQLPAWTQRNALADGLRLRQRFANAAQAQNVPSIQGTTHQPREDRSGSTYTQQRADRDALDFADRYDPNPRRIQEHAVEHDDESAPPRTKVSSRRVSRKTLHLNGNAPNEETKKRSWDNESEFELESAKKSRVEGDELIDGDEDAGWFEQRDKSRQLARGSKRSYGSEVDEDNYPRVNGRDKRSRKASQDKSSEDQDDLMETDDVEEDELTELRSIPRGKKRDRTEAGSTFGGDDEDEVTAAPDDKALRHHKRRTVSKRKSEVTLRGSKRNRDTDAVDSEGEGSPGSHKHKERSSRKKRGKKAVSEETQSDISMDSSMSKDPLCKGRKIGEEWEANGVQYKVGSSGERLQLTLVKKARSKFPMPKDSQHPDRSANLEIYVETWMTEEQHKLAEDRHELVWQDTPRVSVEPQTPGDVPDSPSKTGKNLLWESTKDSPIARRPFRQSIATNVGIRINPFQQSQNVPGRRVASSYNLPTPALFGGVGDSPTRRSSRFSKWEKQDLEAEAMAKMRAKVQEQKKLSGPQKKAGELPTSVTAPELGAKAAVPTPLFTAPAPTPVNSISFTKPADKPAQVSENKAAASTPFSFGATSSTADVSKQTSGLNTVTSGLPTPSSNLPEPTSTGAGEKPKWNLFPPATGGPTAAPSQPAGPSSSVPSFSFAPPPKQSESSPSLASLSAASSVPPSTSIPNFFSSKPAATSQPEAPPKTFAPFSTGAAASGASTAPSFAGFGVSNSEQKKPAEVSSTGGSSLTARLGGFAPQAAADSSKPAGAPASSPFSFGKATVPTPTTSTTTGQQADKPLSVFGNNTSTPSSVFTSAPAASSTTKTDDSAPLKFDFGVKAKPVGSTPKPPMTAPNSMSAFPSTISANTASEGSKPAASTSAPSFSFASPTPAANAAASSSGPSGSTEPPKFAFGQPSAGTGSVFGPPGSSSMTSSTTPKSAFGGFGSDATSKSSPFGTNTANSGANQSAMSSTPTSIFGAANAVNDDSRKSAAASTAPPAFGGFGGNNATSVFGATGAPTATSNSNATPLSMPKTAFSGFGSGATSTSAFSTTPAGSPASVKPFTFGNPTASSSGGNQPAEESKASPFAPSATKASSSPFAFGVSGTSGFGGSNASSVPMSSAMGGASKPVGGGFTFSGAGFGQPPSGAPSSSSTASQSIFGKPSQPTPSSFGFGKPSGGSAFAFGQPSASGQNQQQKQ